jgi:glycosyltransferase involved in cell wall biosynthesis
MHVVVLFTHIGNYHIARLQAAYAVCHQHAWSFTALQVTDKTAEHPWGELDADIAFPIKTLMPASMNWEGIDRRPDSPYAAGLLSQVLDQLQPDVLAIPGWGFPVSRAALKWCQKHRVRSILMSESKWNDERRIWWKEIFKSWLYVKKYDAALVGGILHRQYLVKLGFPESKIFFGYDVVDNQYFAKQSQWARLQSESIRQSQPHIPTRPYFLSVTRLVKRKNIPALINAFAAYCQTVSAQDAWDLVICGSGDQDEEISRLVKQQQLESKVHFPGFIPYQKITFWYGLAEAFIHPALIEQWGLVVNEACAAQLPILVSETVGASELVQDGHNGYLFNPNDQNSIMSAMLRIHSLTGEQRQIMGKASQEMIDNYRPEVFGQGLLAAINS